MADLPQKLVELRFVGTNTLECHLLREVFQLVPWQTVSDRSLQAFQFLNGKWFLASLPLNCEIPEGRDSVRFV